MIPKFRAWDKDENKMWNGISILSWDGNIEGIVFEYKNCGYDMKELELAYYDSIGWYSQDSDWPYIIMQSTGLIDKNGEEIFEGDIITWESPEMTQSTWIGTVFRNGAEFSVRKDKKTYSTGAWLNSVCRPTNNIITVIGDIHQNQELLEGSHA